MSDFTFIENQNVMVGGCFQNLFTEKFLLKEKINNGKSKFGVLS